MMATTRAMLKPCSPPGSPQPRIRSPMSAGSSAGTLASAARIIWATRSSGRMVVRLPLNARPMGERAVATMTASGMADSRTGVADYCTVAYGPPRGPEQPSRGRSGPPLHERRAEAHVPRLALVNHVDLARPLVVAEHAAQHPVRLEPA